MNVEIKKLQSAKKSILSQIAHYKGKGGYLLTQKAAIARPGQWTKWDKLPSQIIAELEQQLVKVEGKILSAQFEAGKLTYRVNFHRNLFGGMAQVGSVLVKAHTAELAMSQVPGAVSVQLHHEEGVAGMRSQLAAIAEWI